MLRKIRKMLQQQEGFTLVELMIVVVILGILAGIGIQQYGNVQERARKAAHEANIKVLTSAANMYLMMHTGEMNFTDDKMTILEATDPNPLVPTYLDDWPTNPNTNDPDYEVVITKTEQGDDVFYSVAIDPET